MPEEICFNRILTWEVMTCSPVQKSSEPPKLQANTSYPRLHCPDDVGKTRTRARLIGSWQASAPVPDIIVDAEYSSNEARQQTYLETVLRTAAMLMLNLLSFRKSLASSSRREATMPPNTVAPETHAGHRYSPGVHMVSTMQCKKGPSYFVTSATPDCRK